MEQWRDNGWEVGPIVRPCGGGRPLDRRRRSTTSTAGRPKSPAGGPSSTTRRSIGLIAAASRQNLSLRVAGLRILEARAQLGIAVGESLPAESRQWSASTPATGTAPTPIRSALPDQDQFSDWQTGFDAAWELDYLGPIPPRRSRRPTASLDAQIDGYDDVLVMLQAEVAANYIQMRVAAAAHRADATKRRVCKRRRFKLVELRYGKGLVTDLDVQRAKANLAATQALVPVLRDRLRKAQNRLCILMAMPRAGPAPRLGVRRKHSRTRRRRSWSAFRPICCGGARRSPRRTRGRGAVGEDRHRRGRILPPHRHHRHDRPGDRRLQPTVFKGGSLAGRHRTGLPLEHPQLRAHPSSVCAAGRPLPPGRRHPRTPS